MCRHFPDLLLICGCPDCQVCIDRELPLPAPSAFPAARSERVTELLDHKAFAPETTFQRVQCALEAPLLGRPAFRPTFERP